jgi:hypothetical protein
MTLPLTHGYPDWIRQKAESDLTVMNEINTALAAPTTFGPFFVGGLAALYCNFSGSAVRSRIMFQFFLDEALTNLVDNDSAVTNVNGYYTGPVPVFGPWVSITVEANAYPATFSAIVTMAPDAASATGSEGSAGRILHANPLNVAAATTTTVTANATWRGMASIYAEIPSAACSIELEALQLGGFTRLLWALNGAVLRDTQLIGVHTDAIRIRLINPTAGALNFRYAVTAIRRSG